MTRPLKICCCPFPNQVHILRRPSFCHRSTPLWAHPSWHHQGHCYSLCPPEWLPCGPALWLGLSWLACGKNLSSWILKSNKCLLKVLLRLTWFDYVFVSCSVCFCRSMRLTRLWGLKGLKMWLRWASLSTTSSAETLSWDTPMSGRWV